MKRDPYWAIAVSGFLGAAGPSLCQFIAMTQEEVFEMPHFNFFLGMFMLGALGGSVALIAKETVSWKALSLGLSCPTVFSSTATVAISVAAAAGPIGYMGAYADTLSVEHQQVQTQDSVEVTVEVEGGKKTNIVAGDRIYRIQQQQTIRVPVQQQIIIEDEEARAVYTPTKDSSRIRVKVKQSKAKGGFWKGLLPLTGDAAQKKLAPKEIDIQEIHLYQSQDQVQEEK